jgi:5-dehydro-2-deoxygluconokinase
MMTTKAYDILAMGRSCIDLYSNDVGVPFEQIGSFAAYVGGCPTNISVGTRRLGLRSALLSAVGEDKVGDFVLHFLRGEGVETRFTPRKPGRRTSAVLLGIEPPDRFPLTYYRDNCADTELAIDDVLQAPVAESRVLLIAGTNLSQEPSRSATLFAAELARQAGTTVALDIDFRPDQWHDPRAFGVAIRSALRSVDIVIGTDDELNAAMLTDPRQLRLTDSQVSDARVAGDTDRAIETILRMGPRVLAQKRGAAGSRVHILETATASTQPGAPSSSTASTIRQIDAPGFPVKVYNILGAGDAFASGLLYGYVQGWDWYRSARIANACGAIVVTRHGCSSSMASQAEALAFIDQRGGF